MMSVRDPIIIIDDDTTRDNGDVTQGVKILCKKDEEWLKFGCYVLRRAERDMLCNNGWLTDLYMNAVQVLIKKQFPHIGGLQNTTIIQPKRNNKPFQVGTESLQIIHTSNNHWIVPSTMNCYQADITVYDSSSSSVNMETKIILSSLLKTQKCQFTIQISNKQSGTKDCGVFATAYRTTVAYGKDPPILSTTKKSSF